MVIIIDATESCPVAGISDFRVAGKVFRGLKGTSSKNEAQQFAESFGAAVVPRDLLLAYVPVDLAAEVKAGLTPILWGPRGNWSPCSSAPDGSRLPSVLRSPPLVFFLSPIQLQTACFNLEQFPHRRSLCNHS